MYEHDHIPGSRRTRVGVDHIVDVCGSLGISQELDMVEDVEEVHAELERDALPRFEVLVNAHVRIG